MISKEDVKHMLQEMLKLENKMDKYYDDLAKQVHTEKYRKVFILTSDDEKEHAKTVTDLIDSLKTAKWV